MCLSLFAKAFGRRAGPGRAERGSQELGRAAGLRESPGSGTTASAEQVHSVRSRSHAWTGPCSPFIPDSRVGRIYGMLPMDLPIEETSPENLTPLFRFLTAGPALEPLSVAEDRDRDRDRYQEQEKVLLPGLLSLTREQRSGRVALVFLF